MTAFTSPSAWPIGRVVEGQVRLLTRPVGQFTVPLSGSSRQVRTGLIVLTLGDDGELLRAAADRFNGLVVAAFGARHVPAVTVPGLGLPGRADPGRVRLLDRRGSALAATYGFPGSEQDLLARGLISAGILDPLKARLLLDVPLASVHDARTDKAACW